MPLWVAHELLCDVGLPRYLHISKRSVARRPCLFHRVEEPVSVIKSARLQLNGVGGVRLEPQ
jgi:hypothetical protein